jgi:hypothetical protein
MKSAANQRREALKTGQLLRWTKVHENLLGTMPDERLAKKLGRSVAAVAARRHLKRIPLRRKWLFRDDKLLGLQPDRQIAMRLALSTSAVSEHRRRLGIPVFDEHSSVTKKLAAMSDREIARLLRMPHQSLLRRRPLNRRTRAPNWSESEDRLVGTWPDDRLARFLGRTSKAVGDRRQKLGILRMPKARPWTAEEDRLLDPAPARGSIKKWTAELAARLGRTAVAVGTRRRQIYGPRVKQRRWSQRELRLLGTRLDREVAVMLGRRCGTVQVKRGTLGIPSYRARQKFKWTPAKDRLLGTQPDKVLANRLGCSYYVAKDRRQKLGVAAVVIRSRTPQKQHLAGTV